MTSSRYRKPNRRDLLALGVGAGAAAFATGRSRAQTSARPDVVRVGYLTAARAWVVGKTDGSFDKALGAKVEWVPFPAGGPALALLAARQIDFAIFGNTPIVAGLSRNLPIQLLGSPEIVATSERLIVKPGIATVKDLEGKRIAVAPSSTMAFALEAVIRINKLDGGKIRRLPLAQPETIAAWKRGDIDATYINGPFWGELLADGGRQLLVSEQLQPAGVFVWNSAVVRTEFAERHPDTVVVADGAGSVRALQGRSRRRLPDPGEGFWRAVRSRPRHPGGPALSLVPGTARPRILGRWTGRRQGCAADQSSGRCRGVSGGGRRNQARGHPGVVRSGGQLRAAAPRVPGLSEQASVRRLLIGAAAVVCVTLLWEFAGRGGLVDPLLLPPPSEILATALDLLRNGYRQTPLWAHLALSLARALGAFAAATVIGVPLGIAMGMAPNFGAAIDPFVQFLRPLPKLALIPLVILWFGIGETSKVLLIFVSALLSIVVGAAAAVGTVQRQRIRAGQALGAHGLALFRYVILPHIVPELFVTLRLSFGIGWTTLIAAEMIASDAGIGWMVVNAGAYLRTDIVMLGIVLLGGTGYALDLVLVGLQRWAAPWAGRA